MTSETDEQAYRRSMIRKYEFYKTKYGEELLIDLIRLESLEKYILKSNPHTLSYYDITLITGGEGRFSSELHEYKISKGKVLFSSPGLMRNWSIETMPKGLVLIFEEAFLSCFLNDLEFISNLNYFHSNTSPLELSLDEKDEQFLVKLLIEIETEIDTFNKNDKHILRALLYQALIWLNRKYADVYGIVRPKESNRHIRNFTKLVNAEYHAHHDVLFYADKLNITQGHLNNLSQNYLGVSAKHYIQNRVMIEAKKLIAYSDIPIAEIAFRLNFQDPAYFIRKFRKTTGTTPLVFRRQKNP